MVHKPGDLHIGHTFLYPSHCLMQAMWKPCPQSNVPSSSSSTKSSCHEDQHCNAIHFDRHLSLSHRNLIESQINIEYKQNTWQMLQKSF